MHKGKDNTYLFTDQNKKDLDCSFACNIHQASIIMLIQNVLLFGFAFSSISAGLPKTEATWQFVISDLEKIDNIIQVSTHFSINYLV